jgi:hypothetical protein
MAKAILGQGMSTYFPGGNLLSPSAAVAGFSPDQLAAMQMTEQLSGAIPNTSQSYLNWNPLAGPQQPPQMGVRPPQLPMQASPRATTATTSQPEMFGNLQPI